MFSVEINGCHNRSESANNATIGDLMGSSKLLVPGRVTASTNIPQGAMTLAIEPELLIGSPDIVQILVGANSFGTLELDGSSKQIWDNNVHWIRAIRISEDCHSYNVQLKLETSPNKKSTKSKLILQAVRSISSGQELMLWFSEDILALLQMVFLTPANIQGQKRYICTRCSALYESPNPLKLHLVLGCERQSMSDLWKKLSNILSQNDIDNSAAYKVAGEFTFKLTAPIKQKNAIDLSKPNLLTEPKRPASYPSKITDSFNHVPFDTTKILYRPYSEPSATHSSAFKPFQKLAISDGLIAPYSNRIVPNGLQAWPNISFSSNFYTHDHVTTNSVHNDESQMETIVSSLGKSKEGHICLYCGKCYSRKYGLKIHIRTHTGYKPLKCKFCMRPFGDPSNLNKHVRLHAEGDTPYKCDLCGKILVRRRDLERHLKSRHMSEIHPGRSIVENRITETDITDADVEEAIVDR